MIQVKIKADSRYPVNKEKIRQKVSEFLKIKGIDQGVEVSIAVVGSRKMLELSRKYLKDNQMHSVLSFPLEDVQNGRGGGGFITSGQEALPLGDIVISYPQALKQAAEKSVLLDDEIDNLVEHGLKHLLGEHHN